MSVLVVVRRGMCGDSWISASFWVVQIDEVKHDRVGTLVPTVIHHIHMVGLEQCGTVNPNKFQFLI